ncbi:MAG: [LysW]-aminoadipate kinase [bacterium]|nr:[LysW]-aminoadipate kinase [bacterium]
MILIKAGGGKSINWNYIAQDIFELQKKEKVIIVHGAGSIRNEIADKLGYPTKVITSPSGIESVFTDDKAIEIFTMVYCGLMNKKIVETLQKNGVNAVGLSGIDGGLWRAKAKKDVIAVENGKTKLLKNNRTGRVEKINVDLIQLLLKNNYVPVISSPALSYENEIVNTDNDWASAIMAGDLKIETMIVLFEEAGLLKDFKDKKSIIKSVSKNELDIMMQFAHGRMKKKILGAKKAFELGLKKMYWGDGRIQHPIINVLHGNATIIS